MMDICLINREQHIHSRIPRALECKRQVRTPENLHAKLIDTMEFTSRHGSIPRTGQFLSKLSRGFMKRKKQSGIKQKMAMEASKTIIEAIENLKFDSV